MGEVGGLKSHLAQNRRHRPSASFCRQSICTLCGAHFVDWRQRNRPKTPKSLPPIHQNAFLCILAGLAVTYLAPHCSKRPGFREVNRKDSPFCGRRPTFRDVNRSILGVLSQVEVSCVASGTLYCCRWGVFPSQVEVSCVAGGRQMRRRSSFFC